jgi:hypothetical protein
MAVELRGRFNLLDNFPRRALLRQALRPHALTKKKLRIRPLKVGYFTAEKRPRQDALQTTSSARLDIFYLQNFP